MKGIICSVFLTVAINGAICAQTSKPLSAPFGVNLAGADFGANVPGVFNKDYTYPTGADLDYVKSKGLTLIRLPFLWERMQPVLGESLDAKEVERFTEVIDAAAERGILVLPDMHNYCRRKVEGEWLIIGSERVPVEQVANAWAKIADLLKDKKNIWGYGIMNEPHDMPAENSWFTIAQAIITSIRSKDSKTAIVVGGDSWSSAERWPYYSGNLKNLNDPANNLIFEAHIYFDENSSGSYKYSYEKERATAETGIVRAMPFVKWLKANNLKGFIGEYGVPDNDPRWLVTLDKMLDYLQKNGVNGTYWAAGPWWGDYHLAVQPKNGIDRPQMKVVSRYPSAK
ncbi:glycoside hydrolase family 5 protein [Desertivirga xinjiangensis]|uniref:glycoside hydrolase family 5 protein n=1 Tax=Desertivirga xinjiangensis TaxID=539206 RepID=UPI00210EB647|nr:glycoside hydrolase family 5 protein [Pedobacter xinjiangensis]